MKVRIVLLLAVGLLLAGCNIGDRVQDRLTEEVLGRAADGDVEIDRSDGSVRVETDEGTVSFGGSADLPDDFPEAMPVPDGIEVAGSFATSSDSERQVSVQAQTQRSFDDLRAYFGTELPASGWEITGTNETDFGELKSVQFVVEGHGWEGVVAVTLLEDESEMITSLTYTLTSATQ